MSAGEIMTKIVELSIRISTWTRTKSWSFEPGRPIRRLTGPMSSILIGGDLKQLFNTDVESDDKRITIGHLNPEKRV